jgi:hypothetical protein
MRSNCMSGVPVYTRASVRISRSGIQTSSTTDWLPNPGIARHLIERVLVGRRGFLHPIEVLLATLSTTNAACMSATPPRGPKELDRGPGPKRQGNGRSGLALYRWSPGCGCAEQSNPREPRPQPLSHCVHQHRVVLAEDYRRRDRVKAERLPEGPWPLANHSLSRRGKDVDTKRVRPDGVVMCVVSLSDVGDGDKKCDGEPRRRGGTSYLFCSI